MAAARQVVLVAAEAVPFAKTGGLGDVIGALAPALAGAGAAVTVVLPAYGHIPRHSLGFARLAAELRIPVGSRSESAVVWRGSFPDRSVSAVLIDHPGFFHRDGMYVDPTSGAEYADAASRWVFFSQAALAALPLLGAAPDVLHLNDHHCALSAVFAAVERGIPAGYLQQTAVVFGIHNLGYQGLYAPEAFALTGLTPVWMRPLGPLEFWGRLNAMKSGLVLADALTTVSPTYALEIQSSPEYGFGLEGVLRGRSDDLFGILNGIDTTTWDPRHDAMLPARFDADDLGGKAQCKQALQQRCGLPLAARTPLFGLVSRLVEQKGIDLLLAALDGLLAMPLQIVLLGRGRPELESRLREHAATHPEQLAVLFEQDESLAHWIEAGSDFFLMPSRYEPCGLNQMYSMRYGTVPVVRRTGGLADTVQDWDGERGTGFVFVPATAAALVGSVRRAVETFGDDRQVAILRRTGMQQDFSWARSASRYLEVYERALAVRRAQGVAVSRGGDGSREGH